jgi:hypothetical protein
MADDRWREEDVKRQSVHHSSFTVHEPRIVDSITESIACPCI